MGRFFDIEDYSISNEFVDAAREVVDDFPEIFTDFEVSASVPGTTGSIALFVSDDEVIVINTYAGDDGGEYASIESWLRDGADRYYDGAVVVSDANEMAVTVLGRTNHLLGYRFVADVPDVPVQVSEVEPGDDEGAVADFLDFAQNSAGEIVRVECVEMGGPVVARFVVETRHDGEIERDTWVIERVRQG